MKGGTALAICLYVGCKLHLQTPTLTPPLSHPLVFEAGETVYVTPALIVIFIETTVVSFNATSCTARHDREIKFSLEQDVEKMFSIRTGTDIVGTELPALNNALEYTYIDPEIGETERADKITRLTQAIDGWERVLARTANVQAQAANGTLARAFNLFPDEDPSAERPANELPELQRLLLKTGRETDPDAVEPKSLSGRPQQLADPDDATNKYDIDDKDGRASAGALDEFEGISFTGGGVAYDYSKEFAAMHEDAAHWETSIEGVVYAQVDLQVSAGVTEAMFGAVSKASVRYEQEDTSTSQRAAGFHLEDADPGDIFNVKVRLFLRGEWGRGLAAGCDYVPRAALVCCPRAC